MCVCVCVCVGGCVLLIMAFERSDSAWYNFGEFIKQIQTKTKKLIKKFESILIKLYIQCVFIIQLTILIYIYIYIYKEAFIV